MDLRDRQATYNGFGNALALAVEMVVTPFLFGLLGYWIDGRAGTRPVFTVALAAFGVVGTIVRMIYAYNEDMKREQEGKPWTRSRP